MTNTKRVGSSSLIPSIYDAWGDSWGTPGDSTWDSSWLVYLPLSAIGATGRVTDTGLDQNITKRVTGT